MTRDIAWGITRMLLGLVALVSLFALLGSCHPCRKCPPQYVERTITDTVEIKEIELRIEQDQSFIEAYLECDSTNQVIMTKLTTEQGKRVKQDVVFRDKIIKVTANVDSAKIGKQYMERHRQDKEIIHVPVEVNRVTWWQQGQIYGFRVLLILLIIVSLWYFIQRRGFFHYFRS
jgi:hypothetical protein